MTSGDEIRRARERAGLTQEQLASRVGVTLRTVGNWERGATVPRNRLAAVEAALAGHLDDAGDEPALRGASDVELLAEIARRFARPYSGEDVASHGRRPPIAAVSEEGEHPDMPPPSATPQRLPGPPQEDRRGSGPRAAT